MPGRHNFILTFARDGGEKDLIVDRFWNIDLPLNWNIDLHF
jgi:hypothetical protein